jgi:hypothetical protein
MPARCRADPWIMARFARFQKIKKAIGSLGQWLLWK